MVALAAAYPLLFIQVTHLSTLMLSSGQLFTCAWQALSLAKNGHVVQITIYHVPELNKLPSQLYPLNTVLQMLSIFSSETAAALCQTYITLQNLP